MDLDVRPLAVIQPRATQAAVVEDKAQGLDQVQPDAGVGAQAHDIAGIGRNLGLEKDDIEHRYQQAGPRALPVWEHHQT